MFHWLINRRRKKLTQALFPSLWENIIRRNVAHYCMLEDAQRAHLRTLIKVFIAEKNWEGAGGLELTDEIRVTISAQACLLLLDLPHNYYRNVESIIVYPSTVVPPQRHPDFFENTNEAEFFAVATEQFFDQPRLMIEHAPDLYRVLQEYYRQDPAERASRNYCMAENQRSPAELGV